MPNAYHKNATAEIFRHKNQNRSNFDLRVFYISKDAGTEGVGTSLSIFIRDENVVKLISRNRTSRQSFANFGRTRTKINILR